MEVQNSGIIEGVVTYRGSVPPPRMIQVVKDHEVCDARDKSQDLIKLNEEHQVREVVVFLSDIKAGKPLPVPEQRPVLDQKTCTFAPHVLVLVAGQPFEIVNSDPVAHNANCVQSRISLFNPLQPKQGMRSEFTIKRPGLARFNCAVHNWMNAYAWVLWHPYYAITGEDGKFVLSDVPPGEYELVAWQEHVGERDTKVTVRPGETTQVEFELTEK